MLPQETPAIGGVTADAALAADRPARTRGWSLAFLAVVAVSAAIHALALLGVNRMGRPLPEGPRADAIEVRIVAGGPQSTLAPERSDLAPVGVPEPRTGEPGRPAAAARAPPAEPLRPLRPDLAPQMAAAPEPAGTPVAHAQPLRPVLTEKAAPVGPRESPAPADAGAERLPPVGPAPAAPVDGETMLADTSAPAAPGASVAPVAPLRPVEGERAESGVPPPGMNSDAASAPVPSRPVAPGRGEATSPVVAAPAAPVVVPPTAPPALPLAGTLPPVPDPSAGRMATVDRPPAIPPVAREPVAPSAPQPRTAAAVAIDPAPVTPSLAANSPRLDPVPPAAAAAPRPTPLAPAVAMARPLPPAAPAGAVAALSPAATVTGGSTVPGPPAAISPGRPEAAGSTDLDALLGEEIAGLTCAAITFVFDPAQGKYVLTGFTDSGDALAALRRSLSRLAGADILDGGGVTILPQPYCRVLAAVREAGVRPSTRQRDVAPGAPGVTRFRGGDVFRMGMLTPEFDSYVYVDYFTQQGDVAHLVSETAPGGNVFPRDRWLEIGGAAGVGRPAVIAPPFGLDWVLAIASSRPLGLAGRPDAEPVEDYLPALAGALERLRTEHPEALAEHVHVFVRTLPAESAGKTAGSPQN